MQTRLQTAFQRLTFNEAGMMTRRQKATFNKLYGEGARKVQEVKNGFSSVKDNLPNNLPFTLDKWNGWVSPSRFWDYFQEDEFMYVLNSSSSSSSLNEKKVKEEKENKKDKENKSLVVKESYSHRQMIFDEGKLFEEKVMQYYRNIFNAKEIVQVAPGEDKNEVRNKKLRNKTIQEMMKGTPIIYQGVLWNEELKCYGVADMIVRNDYLPKLVENFTFDDLYETKAPNLKGDYHYRVIDIKNKKLVLNKKNRELSDAEEFRYPKAQLWFYNYEVSRIQGFNPQTTYVLGNSLVIGSDKKNPVIYPRFNYMFGRINYQNSEFRNYEKEVRSCISWIHHSQKYANKLHLLSTPLPYPQLYPNMVVKKKFHEDKLKFAQQIGEITLLTGCGKNERMKAFKKGIFSYLDENFNTGILFKGENKKHKIVDAELKLIRQGGNITPTKEEGLTRTFFKEHTEYMAATDFEFLDVHDYSALPLVSSKNIIYMIGFALRHLPTGNTQSMNFTAKELSDRGEKEMVCRFIQHLNQYPFSLQLLHWHHTEKTRWNHLMKKYPDLNKMMTKKYIENTFELKKGKDGIIFSDMLNEFRDEPIVVKDTHGFGLKKVVNKLMEFGIISGAQWEGLKCMEGTDSIAMIHEAKGISEMTGQPLNEIPLTKEIEKYNVVDCLVLLDVYEGIKNYYHSSSSS